MVAKLYLFLRDFVPQGLTGRFAHVKGAKLMNQLLYHPPESTMSRHRVTKHAEAVFTKLQEWMGACKTWQVALKRAQGEKSRWKRKSSGLAPGLHSPKGMRS